jgi:hypothetical protein
MFTIRKFIALLLVMALALPLMPTLANEPEDETVTIIDSSPIPPRDPVDLAVRLRGFDPSVMSITPRPIYQVGAREVFTIGGTTGAEQQVLNMQLVAATPEVYIWIQDGISYDSANVQQVAEVISARILPRVRELFGTEIDIDGDPHIYILTVQNAGPGVAGLFNDSDRFPDELLNSSNEINSLIMALSPDVGSLYLSVVAHEFQHLVQADQDDSEDTWIIEGIAELGSLLALPEHFELGKQELFVERSTANQLNDWARGSESLSYYGAASLFLAYVTQQYGEGWTLFMAQEPSDGTLGVEHALARMGAVDPLSGEAVTFNDVFADFVMSNLLNDTSVADGRFGYSIVPLTARATPELVQLNTLTELNDEAVNQYGTRYFALDAPTAQNLTITFTGQESVRVLPTVPNSGDHFYWSQQGSQGDARLTGRFDLRGVSTATLNFWTWYEIEDLWDYGYISISTDNGASWQVLTTPQMTAENPYDRAFANGYTAFSGSDASRPAPYIGFSFGEGLTIGGLQQDTPAEDAGLQVNDVLTALDDVPLTTENFFGVLDRYRPGQQITLTLRRGGQTLDVPVTLETHPFRLVEGMTEWVEQGIDLTPFAGNEVLIRFDYVTDQATAEAGWVLDDLAIPEIGFNDDFETDNPGVWMAEGWVRINNRLNQDYLVQWAEIGGGTSVTRLLEEGSSGTWSLDLAAGQRGVLAISGITPITRQQATFDLQISSR